LREQAGTGCFRSLKRSLNLFAFRQKTNVGPVKLDDVTKKCNFGLIAERQPFFVDHCDGGAIFLVRLRSLFLGLVNLRQPAMSFPGYIRLPHRARDQIAKGGFGEIVLAAPAGDGANPNL
jgi:hypothetical protein